jgi:hypothetical protein
MHAFALSMIASGLVYFLHESRTGGLRRIVFSAGDAGGIRRTQSTPEACRALRAASLWHVGFAMEISAFFLGYTVMVVATGLLRPYLPLGIDRLRSRRTETLPRFSRDRAA